MHKLQYISQGKKPEEHLDNIQKVLDAGVKLIQLRLKNIDEQAYIQYAVKASQLCKNFDAQLIINDNPIVALKCDAYAVHLGLTDMGISQAKKTLPKKIIGATANTFEDIKKHCEANADYVGLGPFAFTNTKQNLSPILGIEGYRDIIEKMKLNKLNIPVYAIGGITLQDVENIMNVGVFGIAVSGMLTQAENKESFVKEINKILNHA